MHACLTFGLKLPIMILTARPHPAVVRWTCLHHLDNSQAKLSMLAKEAWYYDVPFVNVTNNVANITLPIMILTARPSCYGWSPPISGPPGLCTAATDGRFGPSMASQTVPVGPSLAYQTVSFLIRRFKRFGVCA